MSPGGPGRPIIHGLDHVVIAVRDLDAGAAAYQTLLGGVPTWRAEAQGGGAETVTFGLANMAVELIAPSGEGPVAARLRAVLDAQGEGLASLVFAVGDIERAHHRLTSVGLTPEPIADAVSRDRVTGAARRWRRTRAAPDATHGVRLFLIQHETPPPAPSAVAPGAMTGLDHVVIRTPDPERAAALYGARLGLDMRLDRSNRDWGVRLMFFRCGDLIVEVAHDLKAAVSAGPDRLWGLSYRVSDVDVARARLAGAGLDVSEVRPGRRPGTRVFTVRGGTCGVPTLVLQPAGSPGGPPGEEALRWSSSS